MIKILFSNAERKWCSKCGCLLNKKLFNGGAEECCFCRKENSGRGILRYLKTDQVEVCEFYPTPKDLEHLFASEDDR